MSCTSNTNAQDVKDLKCLRFFRDTLTVYHICITFQCLLRARAVETQCYVIAAAQCGQHNVKRRSYGHAMVRTSALCFGFSFNMQLLEIPLGKESEILEEKSRFGRVTKFHSPNDSFAQNQTEYIVD